MCFGEAETDALTKCLRSAQGDPGTLDVPGMAHAVTRVLECGSGEGQVVDVLGPQTTGEPLDRGVGQVDDFVTDQVLRRGKGLHLQHLLLVHGVAMSAWRAPVQDAWIHPMRDPVIDTSPGDIGDPRRHLNALSRRKQDAVGGAVTRSTTVKCTQVTCRWQVSASRRRWRVCRCRRRQGLRR